MATPSTSPFPWNTEPTLWPRAMDAPASVAVGQSLLVDRLSNITLLVTGTFSATIDLEGSHDGIVWDVLSAGLTSGTPVNVPERVKFVRLNTTAFTSGAAVVTIDGDDQGER